jgi:hypothetical protein
VAEVNGEIDRPGGLSHSSQVILDCALLCLLTAALIWPLFRVHYLDNWMSIEGSFIADARYIRDHFPHPKWHALWYCGTRFDYIYPPLTRFGPAVLSKLSGATPAHAYHVYIAGSYCLGIAGLYFLVRAWTNVRWTAWLAAVALAILPGWPADSGHAMPLRLYVLVKWGEGPHMSSLAILPFAIGFLYFALKRGSRPALGACAFCCALVVSNNLYGAVALLVLFPIAVWAIWLGSRDQQVWFRSAAIAALSYGLCAWWLTPSFFKITARNLMLVALPASPWSKPVLLGAALILLYGSWRFARSRSNPEWPIFLSGSLLFFAMEVLGERWLDLRIVGDPHRFRPELDLLLILTVVEVVRRRRVYAIVAAAVVAAFSTPYILNAWTVYPIDSNFQRRVEYRLAEWVDRNLPGSRIFATGSIRFWYTAWRDVAEVTGGSDQGMQTLMPALASWQLTMGDDLDRDIAWMVAMGSDAIITHEARSQEIYHHIKNPRRFMAKLTPIYDQDGDIIYRVPRRFPGLARVVSESRMQSLQPIPWSNENRDQLQAYAAAVEESSTPVEYRRIDPAEMRLRVRTQPGESVLVQESWDPGWRADDRGRPLEIRQDILGFMRIQTPAGDHDIHLVYTWPLESRIGQILTLLSLLAVVAAALV